MIFTIPGKITGKARARTFYDPRAGKHRSITPKDTATYENWVRVCYLKERERQGNVNNVFMNDEPLKLYITAYFDIPKSFTKGKKQEAMEDLIFPTKKPDADNIAKIICDALNGIAYADDKQIVELRTMKRYTTNEEPFVLVAITKM